MSNYPDNVTEAMIDEYWEDAQCKYCNYFHDGVCRKREEEYTQEEIDNMSTEEYAEAVVVDEESCCDDYQYAGAYC